MSHPTTNPTRDPVRATPATWWGDRGVRTKTLTAVGVTATVAVGVGLMGLQALGSTADATSALYTGNVGGIQAA